MSQTAKGNAGERYGEAASLPPVDPAEEVTQWLKEVGRRRWPAGARQGGLEKPAEPALADKRAARQSAAFRRALLLAILGVVSAHYLYATTNLEILSLPALLVFVFSGY